MRIISLIASSTEIVCALGLERKLVGRSHECDYPDSVKKLPVCTSPKFRLDGTSYEIDKRVQAIVQEGLSVYRVDAQMIEELKPTHIVTQSQCEVCAVSLSDVEEAVCQITSTRPIIVSLQPDSLADVYADIKRVGEALGVIAQADNLITSMRKKMNDIKDKASSLSKPTIACIEWINPPMAAGNWMPELVDLAGGINLFGIAGKHSPYMKLEQLIEADPDIILITPCGFDIKRTKEETHLLTESPDWFNLKAAKNKNVFVADGNQYFNRPGPRLVESLEILAEIIHPQTFSFGHEISGFERLLS